MSAAAVRAALALGGVLAAISVPSAAAGAGPRSATFEATIEGVQTLEWAHDQSRVDACTPEQLASGSERLRFRTARPIEVAAIEVRRSSPLFEITHGRPYLGSSRLAGPAAATLTGSHFLGAIDPGCPGGVEPAAADCGDAAARMRFELVFASRDRLELRGQAGRWHGPGVDDRGALGGAFLECPFWTDFGPEYPVGTTSFYDGDLLPADRPLRERALFRRSKPRIVLSLGGRECWGAEELVPCPLGEAGFRGSSATTARVVLKRKKGRTRAG